MIAFLDACALIYLIEGRAPFAQSARDALAALANAHPQLGIAVSRLTWLECRVGPLKQQDIQALQAYDAFFARPDLHWVELSRDVVELATAIRVQHGLRTPDALQAACCLQLGGQHVFLTGDVAFSRVHGLKVGLIT